MPRSHATAIRQDPRRRWSPTSIVLLSLIAAPLLGQAAEEEGLPEGWTAGPATVALGTAAEVELAAGYTFADGDTTRQLMAAMGNPPSGDEVGLIAPTAEDQDWIIVFEYDKVGYVEDDDQDEIDADGLLRTITEATEAANAYRQEQGGGTLHVVGWTEAPHYDRFTNNLVWALEAEDENGARVVNYNVRLLGRRGVMSVTLVTDQAALARDKPQVDAALAAFRYREGNRYADFVNGDKLAGYGLAALIAGGGAAAAAKLGLFAVLGKFFAKAGKLLVVGAVALWAFFRRAIASLFGRKAAPAADPADPT